MTRAHEDAEDAPALLAIIVRTRQGPFQGL